MSDVNRVVLTGRLTRDPQYRETQGGTAVLGFGLAVGESWRDQAGNLCERANFVDCSVVGRRAAALAPILAKGMPVTVEGRLRFSRWERGGQVRTKLDVVVTDIVLPPRQAACQPPAQQGWQPDRQGWG